MNAGSGGIRLAHSSSVPLEQRQNGGAGGAANARRGSRDGADGKQRREAKGRDTPKQRSASASVSSSGRASEHAPADSEPANRSPSNREARRRQQSNRRHSNQPQPTQRSATSHAHPSHIAVLRQLSELQRKYMRTFPAKNNALRKGTDDVTSKSEWTDMQREAKQVSDAAAAAWAQSPQARTIHHTVDLLERSLCFVSADLLPPPDGCSCSTNCCHWPLAVNIASSGVSGKKCCTP
jgi:hypothetical protein